MIYTACLVLSPGWYVSVNFCVSCTKNILYFVSLSAMSGVSVILNLKISLTKSSSRYRLESPSNVCPCLSYLEESVVLAAICVESAHGCCAVSTLIFHQAQPVLYTFLHISCIRHSC
jgi:hypothetical protein